MKSKKIILIILIVIATFIIFVWLYKINWKFELVINDETIVLNYKSSKNIDLKTLKSGGNLLIKNNEDKTIKVNNEEIKDNKKIENIIIGKDNTIKLEVPYLFFLNKTYYINTLPSDFPKYEVQGESIEEGEYYLTTYNNLEPPYYLFKLDEKGNINYYKKTKQATFDFKKDIIEGEEIYSYLEIESDENNYKSTVYCPCKLILMDENFEVIKEIKYIEKNGDEKLLENHGALILGKDHYILSTIEKVDLNDTLIYEGREYNKVVNNKIEEVKDGKVLWEFETIEYPSLLESYETPLIYENDSLDYAHYNSCVIDDKDGNLICSFRNLDALIKINRESGKLMWILGGKGDQFNLTDEQKFAKQHSVEILEDGTLLIFDNANMYDESRVVEFKIDETNKKVEQFKEYKLGLKSTFMGSAQKLNEKGDTYVLCYGGGPFREPVLEEKNMITNKVYFSFNLIDSQYLYRIYKIK